MSRGKLSFCSNVEALSDQRIQELLNRQKGLFGKKNCLMHLIRNCNEEKMTKETEKNFCIRGKFNQSFFH